MKSKSIWIVYFNVIRRDWVNSLAETWVNESLSYLDFFIKSKTPSYRVTVTKRVSIPGDWPKPQDRTIVRRYVIRDESEESHRNCKFVANSVFWWGHLHTQKGHVTNMQVAVNTIQYYDWNRIVLEELSSLYDHVIILGYYWRNWGPCTIIWSYYGSIGRSEVRVGSCDFNKVLLKEMKTVYDFMMY